MPPKRRANDLTSNVPKKMPKVSDESDERKQVDFDKRKRDALEHALDAEDSERVLKLGLEFIDWQVTSSQLAKRLQKFFVKAKNQELADKLLNYQNSQLWTPLGGVLLWSAVNKGQVGMAEMLVRAHVDLSLREPESNSTILHAVLTSLDSKDQKKKENLALLMLEHGADIDAVDKNGRSILHSSIRNEHVSTDFVEKLLQRGVNVRIKDENYMSDIYYAVHYKPKVLLKLIQQQLTDQDTRNRRGVTAIEYLIKEKGAEKLKMIKSILDLGVPVNNPIGNQGCSLLHSALQEKNLDVMKLLLKNGANVHQKDDSGSTLLYKAALKFKGFSHASRLLISHGAIINQRNSNGRYPIHGACGNESLRNVHLFLSLGANLAVTDNEGRTPFDSMTADNISLTEAGRLVIKHFALMTSKGIPLLKNDLKKINAYSDVRVFYNSCLEELENMKKEMVCDNIPYFSLLSDNVNNRLLLVKNVDCVETFKKNDQKNYDSFAIYFFNLKISFEIAVKQLRILESKEEMLKEVFSKIFPINVIEKIAYYASLKKMKNCEKLSFLALHENSKHNQSHKRLLI